jgi:hypothetical protein
MLTNILRDRPRSSTLLAATLLLLPRKHNELRFDLYNTEFEVPVPLAIEKEMKFFKLHRNSR